MIPRSCKETESKGVCANLNCDGSLKEDLKNVINLMGPNTPSTRRESETSETSTTRDKLNYRNNLKQVFNDESQVPSTPCDISEYSSMPTDSVEVYLEPRCLKCHSQDEEMDCRVSRKSMLSRKLSNILGISKKTEENDTQDLYKINIIQTKNDSSPPRRVIFDLVEDLPKTTFTNAATNTSLNKQPQNVSVACSNCNYNRGSRWDVRDMMVKHNVCQKSGKFQKNICYEGPSKTVVRNGICNSNELSRVDVYYFDHGNSAYYHTTDSPPVIMMEILAEKTENYTMKFWAEIFGTIHVGFSFFTSFVLQLFRFILHSLVRPLTIGLLQLLSDYCIKPCLATVFNALVQPPLIFIYNICTSLRDICDPIAEGFGYFIREISVICRSIRCCDKNTIYQQKTGVDKGITCNCDDEEKIV